MRPAVQEVFRLDATAYWFMNAKIYIFLEMIGNPFLEKKGGQITSQLELQRINLGCSIEHS